MNQFRPVMIPEPKHSAAVRTEASLRRARCHLRPADGRVFPSGRIHVSASRPCLVHDDDAVQFAMEL